MRLDELNTLPLHDATLHTLEMFWVEGQCKLELSFSADFTAPIKRHRLTFSGVTMIHLTNEKAWGPSVSVNSATVTGRKVAIEMQTGDVIEIEASSVEFNAP